MPAKPEPASSLKRFDIRVEAPGGRACVPKERSGSRLRAEPRLLQRVAAFCFPRLRIFEIPRVLVRFNRITRRIVNANHSIISYGRGAGVGRGLTDGCGLGVGVGLAVGVGVAVGVDVGVGVPPLCTSNEPLSLLLLIVLWPPLKMPPPCN